jgi:nitrate/TMAO reductase-like tetraheme cytochrome c subunit
MIIFLKNSRTFLYSALLFLLSVALFQGCSGFSHLTATDSASSKGPSAKDCGSCHLDQYREWQGSAHNLAYTDPLFRKATDEYDDDSCLPCHIPASVRTKELSARSYNLHEGVSCVSCHLEAGTMYGPHPSSALVNPHPVAADTPFYKSSSLCGVCHEETFATWQEISKEQHTTTPVRECQQCHMVQITRTSTRGTNVLSRLLVSFEDEHVVRSHTIALNNMATFAGAVQIRSERTIETPLHIQITNQLPHNLPGGEYTESTVVLTLTPDNGSTVSLSAKIFISDTDTPLAPGESKEIDLQLDSYNAPLMPQTSYSVQLLLQQAGKSYELQLAKMHLVTGNTKDKTQ